MNADLQHRLYLALENFSSAALRRDYVRNLAQENPSDAREIRQVGTCFERRHDLSVCLPGGDSYSSSPEAATFYQTAVRLGEQAVAEHWNEDRYLAEIAGQIIQSSDYRRDLNMFDRGILNSVIDFYAEHLASSDSLEGVRNYLRADPAWAERLQDYRLRRRARVQNLHPFNRCSNVEWDHHHLVVPGFRYAIPVFLPHGASAPWAYYRRSLLALFESLKVFLTPRDLEQMAHPSNGEDISLYFASPAIRESEELLHRCSFRTDDRNGEFGADNHLMEYVGLDLDLSSPEQFFSRNFAATFYHEWGHGIHFRLLGGRRNSSIRSLYETSEASMANTGSNPDLIPGFYETSNPEYARTNPMEFFAQWIETHFISSLTHSYPSSNTLLTWRRRVMEAFFARRGVNPEAFSMDLAREIDSPSLELTPRSSISLSDGLGIWPSLTLSVNAEFRREYPLNRVGFGVGLSGEFNFANSFSLLATGSFTFIPIDFLRLRLHAGLGALFTRNRAYEVTSQLALGLGASVEVYPFVRTGSYLGRMMYFYVGGPHTYLPLQGSYQLEAGVGFNFDSLTRILR